MARAPARTPQAPPADFLSLPFPRKGIDRATINGELLPLTTTWCRNMRPRSPITEQDNGDKRPGLPKLFTNQLTGRGGSTQINHIAALPRIASAEQTVGGFYAFKTTEAFSGLRLRAYGGTRYPSQFSQDNASGRSNRDLVAFRRDYISGGTHAVSSNTLQRFNYTDLSGTPDMSLLNDALAVTLVIDWKDSSAGGYPGVAVNWQTTNDITVRMYAARKATVAGNGAGAIGEPTGMGPFIRGSALLDKYIGACLVRTAADTVRLDIIKVDGATRTLLVSSDTVAIGDPQAWGSSDTKTNPDLFIRIFERDGTIRAICSWKSAGMGNAQSPEDVGAILTATNAGGSGGVLEATPGSSGSNQIDTATSASEAGSSTGTQTEQVMLTCSTTTADFDGNTRGGIAALFTAGGAPADINDRWYVRSITYTKLVPPVPGVLNTCDRNSTPVIDARYFLPASTTGVAISTAGVIQSAGGAEWHAIDDNLAGVIHPYVDGGNHLTEGNTAALRSSFVQISPLDPSYSGRPQVETRGRWDGLAGIDTIGTDIEDVCGAVLRLNSDLKSGILVEVMHRAGMEPNKSYQGTFRQDSYEQIRFVGLANGARYTLATYTLGTDHMPPWQAGAYQRWEDNGATNLTDLTISWKHNGITLRTFQPSTMAGWAAFTTALNAIGGATAYMNTSKLCGICFRGDDAPPPSFRSWGGRIVDISLEAGNQSVTQSEADLFVFLSGWIYKGTTAGGIASAVPGGDGAALRNPLITTAFLQNLLFMADGGQTLYTGTNDFVGVAELTADRYSDGTPMGVVPHGYPLLAAFQDRLVHAAPRDNPTWWAMSRSGNPRDYDYGADPAESAAIFGANSSFGLPAEPITALIPGPADTLLFGGASRISMIVGDPGLGGQLILRTTKAGILGPRAWCFDDRNNMFMVGGAGGLYLLPAGGGDPVNVDRGRWGSEISKIDGATHFVQLCFDPVRRRVHIYKSHVTKNVPCVHYVYDLANDACLEDTIDGTTGGVPARQYMNPWAVAQADVSVAAHRGIMLGCQDGYVRRFSDSTLYDEATDGTQAAIDAEVDIYPLAGGRPLSQRVETMAEEFQTSMDPTAGACSAYWITADTNKALVDLDHTSAVATIALAAGWNYPTSIRATAAAHKLRLRQSSASLSMAIQDLAVSMSTRSRRR